MGNEDDELAREPEEDGMSPADLPELDDDAKLPVHDIPEPPPGYQPPEKP